MRAGGLSPASGDVDAGRGRADPEPVQGPATPSRAAGPRAPRVRPGPHPGDGIGRRRGVRDGDGGGPGEPETRRPSSTCPARTRRP